MSQTYTRSSQSARTHPALASSVGLRGRPAPSSAALNGEEEEEEEGGSWECVCGRCDFLFLSLMHHISTPVATLFSSRPAGTINALRLN